MRAAHFLSVSHVSYIGLNSVSDTKESMIYLLFLGTVILMTVYNLQLFVGLVYLYLHRKNAEADELNRPWLTKFICVR
jgi:hypothetical protein